MDKFVSDLLTNWELSDFIDILRGKYTVHKIALRENK